jgi:tetratricopeptide (TPR) repeat protein
MYFKNKLNHFLKKENRREQHPLEEFQGQVAKDPGNARFHLKLAEIYQKKREKKKAIAEYLLAAEIFAKNNQYAEAMAIYKQVPKQDPSLDHVYLKIADIYRKMGFLGDAFAQYRILVNHYDKLGRKDKALEVMGLIAELDLRKIDLNERVKDIGEISKGEETNDFPELREGAKGGIFLKGASKSLFDLNAELETGSPVELEEGKEVSTSETVHGPKDLLGELEKVVSSGLAYPNFNYHMGEAYWEMGFFDHAQKQFQLALEKGQNPFESAFKLGLSFKRANKWNEACRVFESALRVKEIPEGKRREAKYELGLVCKELGKTEEAFQLLREVAAVDHEFLTGQDGAVSPSPKTDSWKNCPNIKTGG